MISAFIARGKVRQILLLMEEERQVLLNGPLSSLMGITSKRAAILDALENGGPVSRSVLGAGLAQIRDKATRNKKLFESSILGMNNATETLRLLEENLGAMQTYTSRGEKVMVLQSPGKKDHRV